MRPWWHRALSAVLAVWFALVLVEPAALHACPPECIGHAAASASAADAASAHHAHSAPERPAPAGSHTCTCLGDCAGSVVARAPEGQVALVAQLLTTPVAPGRPQHEFVAAWVAFVLPFATAPPALAAV